MQILGFALSVFLSSFISFSALAQNPDLDQKLLIAAQTGTLEEVQSLVEQGANVNAQDNQYFNWTPLFYAATKNRTDVVTYLLSKGADVHQVTTFGELPNSLLTL